MEPSGVCQYCYESTLYGDNHLDFCAVYKAIMKHLNPSNSSEEELPSTQELYDFRAENSRLYNKPQVFPLRPIKKSINACIQCRSKYDNRNLPFLLPACGHTFCKTCLGKMSYKSMIRCSVCTSITYKELKKLPVNYALVEAFDSQTKKPKCKEHNSEIMAYCNTDDLLLCGACTFNHRSHDAYVLTDPIINELANSKKDIIKKQEQDLLELKDNWEKARIELQLGLNELHVSVEKHKKSLEATEERLTNNVRQGSSHCIQEIFKLAESEDCLKLKKKIKERQLTISARLTKIREIKEKHDALSTVEKLTKTLETEEVDCEQPPSLSPLIKTMEKLKGIIDYESCIKKHNLKIT